MKLSTEQVNELIGLSVEDAKCQLSIIEHKSRNIEPGDYFEGGYLVGYNRVNGMLFAVIMSQKAYEVKLPFVSSPMLVDHKGTVGVPGIGTTVHDGVDNLLKIRSYDTSSLVNPNIMFQAIDYCLNVSINGFNDWYLPSLNELDLAYRTCKPTSDRTYTHNPYNHYSGWNSSSFPEGKSYSDVTPTQTKTSIFRSGAPEAFDVDVPYLTSTVINSNVFVVYFKDGMRESKMPNEQPFMVRPVRRVLLR
jgi:hypothetical protein